LGLKGCLILAVIIACAVPGQLFAEDLLSSKKEIKPLRYDLKVDLAATIGSSAVWVVMEALQDHIAPSTCRWCGVNGFDGWGHNNLKWSNRRAADISSHVTAYGLAPLVAFGLDALAAHSDDQMQNFAVDALIIAESAALSSLFNQVIKISVGRQRPDAHYGEVGPENSSNTSFYSGHTNLTFALAVSSGTVATMRGYKLAPLIWGAGLGVAATTGYLRIAADRHYITDVIGGAVIGSAFGFCIPYLLHRSKKTEHYGIMMSPVPTDGGMVLNISGNI